MSKTYTQEEMDDAVEEAYHYGREDGYEEGFENSEMKNIKELNTYDTN